MANEYQPEISCLAMLFRAGNQIPERWKLRRKSVVGRDPEPGASLLLNRRFSENTDSGHPD